MYNRYVRNDHGTYTCIPQEENSYQPNQNFFSWKDAPPRRPPEPPPAPNSDKHSSQTVRRLLDHLHLEHVDTGDLLLLLLLFLLFEEDADEELLIALGLLLIL